MAVSYTNRPRGTSLVPARKQASPYIADTGARTLTAKEKEVRKRKTANYGMSGMSGMSGAGMGNTTMSGQGNFFSVQLSTDFLEKPQSLREKREIYRHFYKSDEIVAQALDLHTELPLSKVRLSTPKPNTCPEGFKTPHDYGRYILSRFQRMCDDVKLFQKLITIVHHIWLDGTAVVWCEDSDVEIPPEVGYEHKVLKQAVLDPQSGPTEVKQEVWVPRANRIAAEAQHYRKNYRGWSRLVVLPMDRVKVDSFDFTEKIKVQLIPSDRDRQLVQQAQQGDDVAAELVADMPAEYLEHMEQGGMIPLGTDPHEGSFVSLVTLKKAADQALGDSILDRCHVPGTPVLVERAGVLGYQPIETLDPETDLILTPSGEMRSFDWGFRDYKGLATSIKVAKRFAPVKSTPEHKYPVLRDGIEQVIEAKDILPGDFLQVPQVALSEKLTRVDLAAELDGVEELLVSKQNGSMVTQTLKVTRADEATFDLEATHPETSKKFIAHLEALQRAVDWAATLQEPTTIKAWKFCKQIQCHSRYVLSVLDQLSGLGVQIEAFGTSQYGNVFDLVIHPFRGEGQVPKTRTNTRTFSRWLDLDFDLGYLLGYWLGDGWVAPQSSSEFGVLGLCYGTSEPNSVKSIQDKILPVLTRLGAAWYECPVSTTVSSLFAHHSGLVRWIAANFGQDCSDKRLPRWVFDAPQEFLHGILHGFVDSDGNVTVKKSGTTSVVFSGTNKVLLEQVALLCQSLGYPASLSRTKSRRVKMPNGTTCQSLPMYSAHFSQGPCVQDFYSRGYLAKRKNAPSKDGRSGVKHLLANGKLYYRVDSVSTVEYSGPVFSLNVPVDHAFYAGGILTKNCLNTLIYRDKLRQAQTSIASRAMTPKRIVWAEGLSDQQTDALREQVDLALVDPDYSIVANYEIHWEEMGSRDRLLDLQSEHEQTQRLLMTGLGVTESLMSGESLYSGDRLKLGVINQRYLHLREIIQDYVEKQLFEPVARRMGFVEKDEWGQEVVLYPKLQFNRLPLQDSQDMFDALFNLYQKGSVDVGTILELLNLDPDDTRTRIERDMFTVNDPLFNEVIRGLYSEAGRVMTEKSSIVEKLVAYLKLEMKPEPKEEESGGRF